MHFYRSGFYIALILMYSIQLAYACPLCHTETGEQVRRGILDQNFFYYFTATIAPFAIIAIIVSMILWKKKSPGSSYES